MRLCGRCDFPLDFARMAEWRSDGTIVSTERGGRRSLMTCLESSEIESLMDSLSSAIGMPVERFMVDAQRTVGKTIFSMTPTRHIRRWPQNRFFRPEWLARRMIRFASREVAALGFGVMSLESYRPGETIVIVCENPTLPARMVGSALGFYESIEDMPSATADWEVTGDRLVIRMRHADEKPVAEERLYFEDVVPGSGPVVYERCTACGVPLEASRRLEWDLGRGEITNTFTGRREVIIAVQSINALQRELERELGEEVSAALYEAQRRFSRGRLGDAGAADTDAFWDAYLDELAVRGLGYPARFERGVGRLSVKMNNAYNETLYAARLAAAFEEASGGPSQIEWLSREKDSAAYTISEAAR